LAEAQRLSLEEVHAIADLAKLDLTGEELAVYAAQLSQILDYFTMLQELDTSHVNVSDSVLPHRNVLREDAAHAALTPQQAVANASDAEAGQFKVRAVLGDE